VIGLTALLAFSLRAAWLLRPGSDWAAATDSRWYLALADGLRRGCGFRALWKGVCDSPELLRTPGYPMFLALLGQGPRAIVAIQAVMGGLVCLMVAVFLNPRFGARVAIFSALLIAINPETITASKEVLSDQSFQLLIVAGVFCAMWATSFTSFPKRAAVLAFCSGIIVGVATLFRPADEIVIGLLALPFLVRAQQTP
jgi:Dolichyl-phosphate-mannose-protein mannosyltransferase